MHTHTHTHCRTIAFPYIFIYNPIVDKEGKYRFAHLLFGFQFAFCCPVFGLLSFSLLCLAVLALLCFAWLYLSMTRSRLSPLRPPISPGCPFGHSDAKLRLGLWCRCLHLCRFLFFLLFRLLRRFANVTQITNKSIIIFIFVTRGSCSRPCLALALALDKVINS